ncbi:hypothetical protein DFH07DRAFT_967462 [Mycena maculata]|uniref:Uncharacterized protein n=1 Tax=Mycena maculata TaxID=230809 RepID=A0AAD7I439_9AGAR|nr:hypothetical protein DFH07DRAFT_967462 [Mycena maculata]
MPHRRYCTASSSVTTANSILNGLTNGALTAPHAASIAYWDKSLLFELIRADLRGWVSGESFLKAPISVTYVAAHGCTHVFTANGSPLKPPVGTKEMCRHNQISCLTVVVAGVEEVRGPISPTRGVTAARGRWRAQGRGLCGRMTRTAEAGAHARPLMPPRRCWGSELGSGSSRGRASDGQGSVAGAGGECCRRRSIGQRLPKQPYLKQTSRSCTSHGRGGHDEDEGNIRIDPEKQDTDHIRATRRPECLRVVKALFAKAASPARGTTERAEIYKHEAYVKADKLDLGRHDKYSVN